MQQPPTVRLPKTTAITDDFEISNTVLGLGINGKVVKCSNRQTGQTYALKVCCGIRILCGNLSLCKNTVWGKLPLCSNYNRMLMFWYVVRRLIRSNLLLPFCVQKRTELIITFRWYNYSRQSREIALLLMRFGVSDFSLFYLNVVVLIYVVNRQHLLC